MIKYFRHIRKDLINTGKISKYFKYAIGEIILVVIGILLAVQINNWNENRKTQNTVNTTITLLKDEINTNLKSINSVTEYHIMVRDTIDKLEKPRSTNELPKTMSFWEGMRAPRLQNAAFQTTIQSGVSKEFNPQLLKALNKLYAYQDSYNEYTASSLQILNNSDFNDLNNFDKITSSMGVTMSDLYYSEYELTIMFKECLAEIDAITIK